MDLNLLNISRNKDKVINPIKFTSKAVAHLMTALVSLIKLSDHLYIIFKNILLLQSEEV